jgi:GH15 family glucan-1,4-alpha-glucosidase
LYNRFGNFFTVGSSFYKDGNQLFSSSVRAGNFDGLIFQCSAYNKETSWPVFKFNFRDMASPDGQARLTEIKALKNGSLSVKWSNNTFFILFSNAAVDIYKKSNTVVEMHFSHEVSQRIEVFLLAGNDEKKLIEKADSLNHTPGLWSDAEKLWNSWIVKGQLPYPSTKDSTELIYNEFYSRNIYAAFCSNLKGQVPAEITGQYLTNGLPQLYPRDAMMAARALMECGYPESASHIIRFWADNKIAKKFRGEFYARYDAYCQAVDAGSGVKFDEPEWDAGAYLICLLHDYSLKFNELLADTSLIFDLADFLVNSINSNGLLYEGGIVEWTGYHPSTNMLGAAGLMSAAEIASDYGRTNLKEKYSNAWKLISTSLPMLYDTSRQSYTTRRYWVDKPDGLFSIFRMKGKLHYQWDVTSVFGVLWGYPDHDLMRNSYDYTWNKLSDKAGVRYFETGDDDWSGGFGSDLFFFNTAAYAEYAVKQHLPDRAAAHINWMIANSNVYGLMPERILADYSGSSEATPFPRSCAEFAVAVKWFAKLR